MTTPLTYSPVHDGPSLKLQRRRETAELCVQSAADGAPTPHDDTCEAAAAARVLRGTPFMSHESLNHP